MEPPLTIHATGADDDTFLNSLCDENGLLRPIGDQSGELAARYPVTITISSQSGDQLEIIVTEDLTVQ